MKRKLYVTLACRSAECEMVIAKPWPPGPGFLGFEDLAKFDFELYFYWHDSASSFNLISVLNLSVNSLQFFFLS